MKAGILRQTNPDWDGPLWALIQVLYAGGFEVSEDDKWLDRLLPVHANESGHHHIERKKAASYVNYLADVIDFFGAQLFTKPLTMLPADGEDVGEDTPYEEFTEDADGEGHDFQELMAKVFLQAAQTRKAIVAVDFPRNEIAAQSRLEERETQADRPRAFLIDPISLLDWKKAEDGSFEWAIIHSQFTVRDSPESARDTIVDQWKVWTMTAESITGRLASWRLFEHRRRLDKDPDKTDLEEVREVDADTTSFKRIPLIEFMLPKGLWIANKVGPLVLEHFRRRTTLVAAQKKSLMAIPFVKLGPEIGAAHGAQPSEAQQDPNRGNNPKVAFDQKGWLRLGADDEVGFAEPDGQAYEIESTQLKELVDEIFRVSHLMAQSVAATGQALSRSGQSKQEDRNATEVVLEALGSKLSTFAARIYDAISEALGDDVFWVAKGLSDFKIRDRAQVVEEATNVGNISIPSKTFKKVYWTQVALTVLDDISPEDETLIREELEKASEEEDKEPDSEFGSLEKLVRNLNQPNDAAQQPSNGEGGPARPGGSAPRSPVR